MDIMSWVGLILCKCCFLMKIFHYPVNFFRKHIRKSYKMFWFLPPVLILRVSNKKVTLLQSNPLHFILIVATYLVQYFLPRHYTEVTKRNQGIHWQFITFLVSWLLYSDQFFQNEILITSLN